MTSPTSNPKTSDASDEPGYVWRSARVAYAKPAQIIYGDGADRKDCTIIELSLSGVSVRVARDARIPNSFALIIDGNRIADCEIVWRRGDQIGARIGGIRALLSR